MTEQEYAERNMKGFEGDGIMKAEFENLIKRYNVKGVIETGTYHGGTARALSSMVEHVATIEFNEKNYLEAKNNLIGFSNVGVNLGNSAEVLEENIEDLDIFGDKGRVMFFLDAHWQEYCPLLDELKVIAKNDWRLPPIIVIHDFFVPNTDLGYDEYKGQKFDYEYIREHIEAIYLKHNGFNYYYNDKTGAEGARRGVIYIVPNEND